MKERYRITGMTCSACSSHLEKAVSRLGISIGFLIPLMYVAMYHMYNEWFGLPIPGFVHRYLHGTENAMTLAMTQFILLLPILYMNRKFFAAGFRNLWHRSPDMDSLIALGASAAVGYGIFAMYRISYSLGHGDMAVVDQYSGDLYFESAGMILTLITVGKYLESRSKGKTSEAATGESVPVEKASSSEAPLAQLADKVAGIFVPVAMGIALVTLPVWLFAGAGAEFAVSSAIAVLVISCPCALGLATPVAIMVGTGIGAKHGILIKSGEALQQAKEIDTVVMDKTGTITSGRLRVRGVGCYVRDMSLETLMQIGAALEKKSEHPLAEAIVEYAERDRLQIPEVRDFKAVFGRGVEGVLAEDITPRSMAPAEDGPTAVFVAGKTTDGKAGAEFVTGGAGNAFGVESMADRAESVPRAKSAAGIPTMIWGMDAGAKAGTRYFVGNRAYMEENGIELSSNVLQGLDRTAAEGKTPLLIADEHRLLGMVDVADEVKPASREAIRKFKDMGIHVVMLTDDNWRTAEAVRKDLGIEVIAEVLPQEKEKKVSELKRGRA